MYWTSSQPVPKLRGQRLRIQLRLNAEDLHTQGLEALRQRFAYSTFVGITTTRWPGPASHLSVYIRLARTQDRYRHAPGIGLPRQNSRESGRVAIGFAAEDEAPLADPSGFLFSCVGEIKQMRQLLRAASRARI
jgi:hypothetical protein